MNGASDTEAFSGSFGVTGAGNEFWGGEDGPFRGAAGGFVFCPGTMWLNLNHYRGWQRREWNFDDV